MKPTLVIVGAGLGGCCLADSLADRWDVTFVELGQPQGRLHQAVRDTAAPAVTHPHIGSGLGGTTALWHNGLIDVDEGVFSDRRPFPRSELAPYYERAFPKLGRVTRRKVVVATEALRQKYIGVGFPEGNIGQAIFFPRRRLNVWHTLRLKGRVNVVRGEAISLSSDGQTRIDHVLVKCDGAQRRVRGDVFVLAAGGLCTPPLLQRLAEDLPCPSLRLAGFNYEDHPSGFVGEVALDAPMYKLWNYSAPGSGGNLRLPLVMHHKGLRVSFQLRPAAIYRRSPQPRDRVKSVITSLRNQPFNPRPYLSLLSHGDDILDILSFRFRVRLPTRHYSLLMVAEQPPGRGRGVWRDDHDGTIRRNWEIPASYIADLQESIQRLLKAMGNLVKGANVFPTWPEHLFSSSHHSGTARMGGSPDVAVCDGHGRVYGLDNLYVCDGSAIPGSGYANTGLTIAALAVRMGDHLLSAY